MPEKDTKAVFEILVREHSGMLMAYLRGAVGDGAASEDLFQEVMLVAWRRLGEFDRGRPFGPWLRGIAGKLVLAHRRKRGQAGLVCDDAVLAALDAQVQRLAERPGDTWEEKVEAVRGCVAALPGTLGESLRLHYWQGLGLEEVSRRLEVNVEAVKKRVQRARAAVAGCLRARGLLTEASDERAETIAG